MRAALCATVFAAIVFGCATSSFAVEEGNATFYARRFAGRRTASGERYDPEAMTAAHRTAPFGTWLRVSRPSGQTVDVRVNDRGPHRRGRIVDVSEAAARKLDMLRSGVVRVKVEVLPPRPSPAGGRAR